MVTQIVGFQALDVLVILHADASPFLVNDVCENRKLIANFYIMLSLIIGQFIAGFLTRHSLLNPLSASAMLLPSLTGSI